MSHIILYSIFDWYVHSIVLNCRNILTFKLRFNKNKLKVPVIKYNLKFKVFNPSYQ